MTARKMTFRKRRSAGKPGGTPALKERKPWYKGLSAWTKTAIVGPVAAAVLGAAILKIVGLADGGGSPASPKPDPHSPAVMINRLRMEHLPAEASMATATVVGAAEVDRLNKENGIIRGDAFDEAGDQRLRALGAANVGVATTTLAVTGNRKGGVRITDIRVLAQCQSPLTGTLFFAPTEGGAYTAKIGFNLDRPAPSAQNVTGGGDEGAPKFTGSYFLDHEYDLALGEPATFVLTATTTRYYCRYRYRFELLVNGKPATQIVPDHGEPLTITAPAYELSTARGAYTFSAYRALYISPMLTNGKATGWSAADPASYVF
ncbi:hypothetical protein GCM10010151_09230 [Actinoallomurus spadix]|uniref:Uncharacterized protein n=2 Tax=Actinoallomurus spadix TaxID=79912 RepID=A0ABN0W021_9ACTN